MKQAIQTSTKKLIAVFLAFVMVFCMGSISVLAEEVLSDAPGAAPEAVKETKTITVGETEYSYEVTLPSGYDLEDTNRSYPVLYVMPDNGISGNQPAMTESLQSALVGGGIMDVIVVRPEFKEDGEVYNVVSAIVEKVDEDYRTVKSPSARAVAGTLTGGYLATILTYTDGNGAWSGEPKLFGMMASIHGDYVGADNIWKETYGDFYQIATNNGEGDGNLTDQTAKQFYTYMDSATEDEKASVTGGANDIISYYIQRGNAYYGMFYSMYDGSDTNVLKLTAKHSAYDDAFLASSVEEAVNGIGAKLVQNMVSGKILLTPQAALASVPEIEAVYELNIGSLYTSYCGDAESDLTLTISMMDSDTGEKVADDVTATLKVKETAEGTVYTNAEAPFKLPNKINNLSTNVTLSVQVLGTNVTLETKPVVRISETGTAPEEQLIDLLGGWKFMAVKDADMQAGVLPKKADYDTWEEVYPCLAWWNSDFSKVTDMNNYAGYAWYVKEFDIPADFPEGNYQVPVGCFDETDICFINGHQIGCTGLNEETWLHEADCWDTQRNYSISSDKLNIGGTNVMTVLTHNNSGGGGWYSGHPGLYSAAAYNKLTSKPSTAASEENTAMVQATVEAQKKAMENKDLDAYAATVDPEYFQSGNTKAMLLDVVNGYIEGNGEVTVTDGNAYVFEADGLFYYQADRTITKADGETVTFAATEYYKVAGDTAYLYGQHDRFYTQTIPSKYRATALGTEEEYADENFLVYLPEGYFDPENADKRYPTSYVLHQLNSSSNSYAIDGIDKLLDEGIAAGKIKDTILVIPDSVGDSWWHNGWDLMVTEEVLPFIDANYRTIPDSRYRFTTGASMGGHGAYYIGLTNPDLFSGITSFFGAINMQENPLGIAQAQSAEYLGYYTHYFVCGNRDLYKFGIPAIALDKKLRESGIGHFFELEEGEHNSAFYLPYVIDAFAYQTAAMPSVNAGQAAAVVSGEITNIMTDEGTAVVEAAISITDAVKEYLQTIPASGYTKNATPDVAIPVTVTISQNGKTIGMQTAVITASEAKSETLRWELESSDISTKQHYDVRVTASVMDQAVECGESQIGKEVVDIQEAEVTVAKAVYKGKAVKPAVTVTYQGSGLKKGTDYTVKYSNNTKPGKGSVTITGKGDYDGTVTVTFDIVPKKNKITSLNNKKGNKLVVKFEKAAGAKKYEVVYAANKDFKSAKTKKTAKTSVTLKNLKKGKTYWVKVRSYVTVNKQKIYSDFSKTVKQKITK